MAPPTCDPHRGTTDPNGWVPSRTAPYKMVPDPHNDPHGIFRDPYRPTTTPHRMAKPPTDTHFAARCVPELNSQGSEFIVANADTGGIACLPHNYLTTTPDHTYHTTPDVNYFAQKPEYNRQEEFPKSCLLQNKEPKYSSHEFQTTRASLYGKFTWGLHWNHCKCGLLDWSLSPNYGAIKS